MAHALQRMPHDWVHFVLMAYVDSMDVDITGPEGPMIVHCDYARIDIEFTSVSAALLVFLVLGHGAP